MTVSNYQRGCSKPMMPSRLKERNSVAVFCCTAPLPGMLSGEQQRRAEE